MNLTSTTKDGFVVIRIDGRFTASGAPLLRNAVTDAIEADSPRIVVDLSDTTFIDSSGLGALIGGLKSARVAGGDLRIAGAPDTVLAVLRLTNLDRVLLNHPSVEAAFVGS